MSAFLTKIRKSKLGKRRLTLVVSFLLAAGILWPLAHSTKLNAILQGLFRNPQAVILKDRTQAEWQALSATKLLLDHGQSPAGSEAAVFVSAAKVAELVKRFEGLQAHFVGTRSALAGSTITVNQFS